MSEILPEDDDFFARTEPDRDGYGRPLIVAPWDEGVEGVKRVPYTRASTLSDYITGSGGLTNWKLRGTAKGIGEREDLAALAAALPVLTGDRDTDRATNKALDEIIERAQDHVGLHRKADYGTAIHGLTEVGVETGPVPARMVDDVTSYHDRMRGLEVIAQEVFVVCDELKVAGTFDVVRNHPSWPLPRAEDKKTGYLKALEVSIQLAIYAHGLPYDIVEDKRIDWSVLAGGVLEHIDHEVGLVSHIPALQGKTILYEVDLVRGWELAKVAAWIRDERSTQKALISPAPDYFLEQRLELSAAIAICESRESMLDIARHFEQIWDHAARDAARARLVEIGQHVALAT